MELYGMNNKKKKRKFWLIPVCVLAALLVCIFILGIILNATNADRENISAAVAENSELKSEIADLNNQISALQEENEFLRTELDARPTAEPEDEPETGESPVPTDESGTTPRG